VRPMNLIGQVWTTQRTQVNDALLEQNRGVRVDPPRRA